MQDHPQDTTNTTPRPVPVADGLELPQPVQDAQARLHDPSVVVTKGGERGALDWFLGATQALEVDVPVEYDTPAGLKKLIFRIKQVDGDTLDTIDSRNRKGDGPFAKLDTITHAAEVVTEATVYVQDAETGKKVDVRSSEFMGGIPSPALAMQVRFKMQPGVLQALEQRIQELAGYAGDRVGAANRSLVEAGKD